MCGIAGIIGERDSIGASLQAMAAAMSHRGPDDRGTWVQRDAGLGLAHARLSIVDLSECGHQPMTSAGGRYTIVLNGEIYNHMELRQQLQGRGQAPAWRGHSDTETLLACMEAWGVVVAVQAAMGMFAFAVWDASERVLTLARDRLGEKPLFYGWQDDLFLFASELKALRAHPAFKPQVDRASVAAFMGYGYVPAPRSIYEGIQKLTPGTLVRVDPSLHACPSPARYWSLVDVARAGVANPLRADDREAVVELESVLARAVTRQQMSDVPLGAFLSGGIDSSTIVALMQASAQRPVQTFTIGFAEADYDESAHARAVANHLGTQHTELRVSPDEARDVIPLLPTLYDEPFADSSQIPTYLVSKLARRTVTVCLTGDGGDEVFGGYNRYSWMRKLQRVPAPMRRAAAHALRILGPAQWDRALQLVQRGVPRAGRLRAAGDKAHKLAGVLERDSERDMYERLVTAWPDPTELVADGGNVAAFADMWDLPDSAMSVEERMMVIDALTYLPDDILCKVDRASMGVSLETRVPFLDPAVIELAWRLPLRMKIRGGQGKWIVRQLLERHVPRQLFDRPKMGFGVPIDAWLRGPLRPWAEELLQESRLQREGFLNPQAIRRMWDAHQSGRSNWQHPLWNALMFQSWRDRWC